MKKIFSLIFAGGLTISGLSAQEKLNVLYVGGSANIETFGTRDLDPAAVAASAKERTADFIKFLRQHFTKVTAVDGKNYSPGMSAAVDVTIFDGMPPVVKERVMERDAEGNVTRYEEAEYLPSDFKYPALCIASYSKQLGNALGSKNDWMCLCLDNYAYNWNKSHPIFNGPFKVNLETEMYPTPESAVEYGEFYDYVAPKELEMFRVSKYSYKDPGHRNIRIGMVSRPWGYLDSPEAEVISGGVSAKSIDAVAIGRHGNMFHWGFAAAPADMLPAAREILANAIVYTAKACTQPIIARKINEVCFTRPMIAESKFLVSQKGWKHYNEMNRSSYESMKEGAAEAEAKKAAGQELDEEDKMYLEYFSHMTEPVDVTYAEHLKLRSYQTLHFELGRAITGQCGSLISQVLYVKQGANKKFAILDAGMTDLIRPALYQAYHKIENITSEDAVEAYDVVGPICESSDVFGKAIDLNKVKRGDLIALRSAGAYGEIMASSYNCRELPQGYTSDELV